MNIYQKIGKSSYNMAILSLPMSETSQVFRLNGDLSLVISSDSEIGLLSPANLQVRKLSMIIDIRHRWIFLDAEENNIFTILMESDEKN